MGPIALLRVLASNPLAAWTAAHFERPIVMGGLSIGRVAVVSEPAAIRRVLMTNADNYQKDWLQRRVLSAGLTNGLLIVEEAAEALVERLHQRESQVVDFASEATRITVGVLERTIFSDGFGRDLDEIRAAMTTYFETIGHIDALDVLGAPAVVPRPSRRKLGPTFRFFEETVDDIIATRQRRLAADPTSVPRDILTLLLEARDPDSGKAPSDIEIRANILTFIAAGQETTANCITWTLYLLLQSH